MTNRELKKLLKKLGMICLLIMIVMIFLLIYTLGNKKAELSIYTSSDYENNLQAWGMEEEELKQYLSVFGNLVIEEDKQDLKVLNMVTNFIDTMCSGYEVQTNENGIKRYDAELAQKVANELKGEYLKEPTDTDGKYTYSETENIYLKNQDSDQLPYCTEITDISKNGEKTEVTYQLARMTAEQRAAYMTGEQVELEIHTIKATILQNEEYEYAKYFVSEIEEQ